VYANVSREEITWRQCAYHTDFLGNRAGSRRLRGNGCSAGLMNYYTPMGEKGKVWFLCKLPGFRTTGGNT